MLTVEEIKKYLRIDNDEEDLLIEGQMKAAMRYIEKTTGKTYQEDDEVWNVCVKMLVAHWYENRGVQSSRGNVKYEYSVTSLMNHIALCGDYT